MSGRCSSIADQLEVWYAYVDLTHRYATAVDEHDGRGIADLFVDDGTWNGAEYGLPVVTGNEAIERHLTASAGQPASLHLVHNHQILDCSQSDVAAASYSHVIQFRPDRVRHLIVRYDDLLSFQDGWRFQTRLLHRGPSYQDQP